MLFCATGIFLNYRLRISQTFEKRNRKNITMPKVSNPIWHNIQLLRGCNELSLNLFLQIFDPVGIIQVIFQLILQVIWMLQVF